MPLYEESTLNKYVVKLYVRAYRDLDGIYTYITENLSEPDVALNVIDELEKAIFSLEQFPERGSIRRASAGDYAMFTGIRASLSRDSLSTGGAAKPHKMLRSSESSGVCCTPVRARNSA